MARDPFLDAIADTLSDAGKLVILFGVLAFLFGWPWIWGL